jgi:hypothetical protein
MFQNDIQRQSNVCNSASSAIANTVTPSYIAFEVYPNPTTEEVALSVEARVAVNAILEIWNAIGQQMEIDNLELHAGNNCWQWRMPSDWSKGLYFFVIKQNETIKKQKILFQ